MTTPEHVRRMREAAQDGAVCNAVSCRCPTCGVIDKLIQGALTAAGFDPWVRSRVVVTPPDLEASYPYRARVVVGGREVYRVMDRVTEVLEDDVLDDIERALEVSSC